MDLMEKLWAIEEIKQLKARYFRFMDGKDWAGMRTIFTADATFDARTALSIEPQGGEDRLSGAARPSPPSSRRRSPRCAPRIMAMPTKSLSTGRMTPMA